MYVLLLLKSAIDVYSNHSGDHLPIMEYASSVLGEMYISLPTHPASISSPKDPHPARGPTETGRANRDPSPTWMRWAVILPKSCWSIEGSRSRGDGPTPGVLKGPFLPPGVSD